MDAIATAVRNAAGDLADTPGLADGQAYVYVPRVEFELRLLIERKGMDFKLWDLGGGLGILVHAASQLGIQATIVDDFADIAGDDYAVDRLIRAGVNVIRHDFAHLLDIDPGVDVVTTMHTIEHLHASPKDQYHRVVEALAPGGLFVIAGPNSVNLRKRISVPLGRASWSTMEHWYETPVFRAHVREPRAADLLYIARDLGLDATILGKNYLGQRRGGWRGRIATILGPLLERRPTLCSDLYLIGQKA